MENKWENSNLIPYKVKNGKVFVFLQKRDKNSKALPSHFSFFGGKGEPGETAEQTLIREIKEELDYDANNCLFLGQYQSVFLNNLVLNVYYEAVDDDFESKIKVNEGEYGKFFSEEEVTNEKMLIESDKKIIKDLYKVIKKHG